MLLGGQMSIHLHSLDVPFRQFENLVYASEPDGGFVPYSSLAQEYKYHSS